MQAALAPTDEAEEVGNHQGATASGGRAAMLKRLGCEGVVCASKTTKGVPTPRPHGFNGADRGDPARAYPAWVKQRCVVKD